MGHLKHLKNFKKIKMGILDNKGRKALCTNPKRMLIYSHPKVGKTSALMQLPGNVLLIDFEDGSNYYDAHKNCTVVQIKKTQDIIELIKELKDLKEKFDYIVIDTITGFNNSKSLINLSIREYEENIRGKNDPEITNDSELMALGYGKGYEIKRQIIKKYLTIFEYYSEKCLIILGHVCDKTITQDNIEINITDIDLIGKQKSTISNMSDAIGILRRKNSKDDSYDPKRLINVLDFKNNLLDFKGTRITHLFDQVIDVSEYDKEKNVLKTFWDKIFIPEEIKKVNDTPKVS